MSRKWKEAVYSAQIGYYTREGDCHHNFSKLQLAVFYVVCTYPERWRAIADFARTMPNYYGGASMTTPRLVQPQQNGGGV